MDKSYFQCFRCFYKCALKTDMIRHINKKNLCTRKLDSYVYSEEELKIKSLNRIYVDNLLNKHLCTFCNKDFVSSSSLKRHLLSYCKNKKQNNVIIDDSVNINNVNIDDSINIINIDDSVNINIDNSVKINLNINLLSSFDKNWNIEHIDNNLKLILLLHNSKFTKTLENILDNKSNLNVLLDSTKKEGIVFNEDKIQQKDIKEILRKSMDKLYEQLCGFYTDLSNPNILDINISVLSNELNEAKVKYNNYKKDICIQNKVNELISNIYMKKKDITVNEIKNTLSEGY
jgi:hypothetical protein